MAHRFFLLLVSLPARISCLSMPNFSIFLNATACSDLVYRKAANHTIFVNKD